MNSINNNPYSTAEKKSFWRTGVSELVNSVNYDIYKKKFPISINDRIATAGSCFAQHIGKRLMKNGFNVLDLEPAFWALPEDKRSLYGYSMYSARYGNIYTVRQLSLLVKEAFGLIAPDNIIWKNTHGKFIDALRPSVEPHGLDSPEEVIAHRKYHLARVREMLLSMDLLVFTLGLTEAWQHKSGTIYPTVPGQLGGEFDPDIYQFINFSYEDIKKDLTEVMDIINKESFPKKYLFTVSPVPLTATATSNHVMVATTYSKSVLRAVVGDFYNTYSNVDYFPSYEIVVNPWTASKKYESNQRNVLPTAVDEVMSIFLNEHADNKCETKTGFSSPERSNVVIKSDYSVKSAEDVVCEEMLLELFNRPRDKS